MPTRNLESAVLKAAHDLYETVCLDMRKPSVYNRATKLTGRLTGLLSRMSRGNSIDIRAVGGYTARAVQLASEGGDVVFIRSRGRKRTGGSNKLRERS